MRDNVVDIKTKKAVFGDDLRGRLVSSMEPHFKEGASLEEKERAATTVEQVICAALVSAAVAFATKVAHNIAGKFTADKP
jgi:hypothetical protein